jgi:glycosyltransferase involved in cell wall biosynthesis
VTAAFGDNSAGLTMAGHGMRWTRAVEGAGSIARVVRAEGLAAVRDRLWDRARDAAARARCVTGATAPWPAAPILNVIGVPMTTAFGGVPLQLRARLRHESMARPVAVLCRESGGSYATASRREGGAPGSPGTSGAPGAGWRLEAWSDGRPRRAMTFSAGVGNGAADDRDGPAGAWDGDALTEDPDWLRTVHTCVRLVNARAVHVENAAGLSLVSLSTLMGIGASTDGPRVPVVLSVHDLALFSRHPHGPRTQAETRAAARSGDSHESPESLVDDRQRFEHAFHHALGTGIVRAAAFTIYPSQFMRHRIEALPHLPAHIVAPGIEPPAPARAVRSARRQDQIALLGGGQEHKGGPRLARIAAALAARGMHVTSYGGYGHEHLLQMRGIDGVRVRGYYRAGSLPELLARQGASVALILSAVPESFSLVLSEAWAAGVPVVAPASGAFVERLRAPDMPALATSAPAAAALPRPGLVAPASAEPGAARASGVTRLSSGHASDEDAVLAGGLLISADPSDEEILAAVERARSMSWDALPTPPTAAQAAERHLALYRGAGFIAETASS